MNESQSTVNYYFNEENEGLKKLALYQTIIKSLVIVVPESIKDSPIKDLPECLAARLEAIFQYIEIDISYDMNLTLTNPTDSIMITIGIHPGKTLHAISDEISNLLDICVLSAAYDVETLLEDEQEDIEESQDEQTTEN